MNTLLRPSARVPFKFHGKHTTQNIRCLATETTSPSFSSLCKKEGDISHAFQSLSGQSWKPLDARFANLKADLIRGNEDLVQDSWNRLLPRLRDEIATIESLGPAIIPQINFQELNKPSEEFMSAHRKRGVAVIRNVVSPAEALQMKEDVRKYLRDNPHTKAFPQDNPQVFELYWSPSQLCARAHPNMLKTHKFLMEKFWHTADPTAAVSGSHPIAYADRVRIRQPGDAKFALGPHVDGGSCERWEPSGYGLGHVYDKIFAGQWEEYDPFEASCRLPVKSDLYEGRGATNMFRMYQGWLSMSHTGPGEGTLLVNPLLGLATAYYMLRPFFRPRQEARVLKTGGSTTSASELDEYLKPENWVLASPQDSWLHGASPGHGLELRESLHPHLRLDRSMVHVPQISPGDYVAWHCDTIHAVDQQHKGTGDSSVMYIPACPLTESNARYLARQRQAFVSGWPGPDFPGGEGEARHIGKWDGVDFKQQVNVEAQRAMGLEGFDVCEQGLSEGQRRLLSSVNETLGFD